MKRRRSPLFRSRWRSRTWKRVSNKKNTPSFKQCDGDYAGSDGAVAYMTIPKRRR